MFKNEYTVGRAGIVLFEGKRPTEFMNALSF